MGERKLLAEMLRGSLGLQKELHREDRLGPLKGKKWGLLMFVYFESGFVLYHQVEGEFENVTLMDIVRRCVGSLLIL